MRAGIWVCHELPVTDRFNKLYPDIRLTIEDVQARQRLATLSRKRFAIFFTRDIGADNTCSAAVFWQERLCVLLPTAHSRMEKPMLEWCGLADMRLLVPVGLERPSLDLCLLERISADGGPCLWSSSSLRQFQGTAIVLIARQRDQAPRLFKVHLRAIMPSPRPYPDGRRRHCPNAEASLAR